MTIYKRANEVTEGQLKLIAKIEDELGLKFKGKTRKDAYRFINKNIEDCRGVYRPYHERRLGNVSNTDDQSKMVRD